MKGLNSMVELKLTPGLRPGLIETQGPEAERGNG